MPHNIWANASLSMVPSDNAGSHQHLAPGSGDLPTRYAAAGSRHIAIHGTKGHLSSAFDHRDAAAVASGRIARDRAVGERDLTIAVVEDAAAVAGGRIARDRAVGDGERAAFEIGDVFEIGDAPAVARGRIARDGTVGECERPVIGDAAASMV